MNDLEELICDLVRIESVNPDLAASGSGEAKIARFVAGWLADAGLDVEVIEPKPGRPSVVGVLRGSGGGRSLMLNAHMDTVGAGGMEDAFTPFVRDGRVYGRGAYDMKASLAAIMLAAKRAPKLKGDLMVTAVSDEEVASIGTAAVVERYNADYCIVTEPTELKLCLAHKGFVWWEVETKGVAAHGSRADIGVDAIALMAPVLTHVLDLQNTLRASARHPLLGTGSIHASLINGGQELSTYPARCVLQIERRTVPGEDVTNEIPGSRMLLERAPSELAANHELSRAVSQAAGSPEEIGVGYWMDMALTNGAGIPTVAYGPIGEGAHADIEWVDLASVEQCIDVYLKVAEDLCN